MECERPIYIQRERERERDGTDTRNKKPGPDRHEYCMGGREQRRTRGDGEQRSLCAQGRDRDAGEGHRDDTRDEASKTI